uniref:Uncharacterized protein n=1 Tax=Elaeophora elaphi TaxID=1147741 RepID=A0A0R3S7E6_9BILA
MYDHSAISLGSGLPTSFPALAQSGALSSPFTLPFQQLPDPTKLARQRCMEALRQSAAAAQMSSNAAAATGPHVPVSGAPQPPPPPPPPSSLDLVRMQMEQQMMDRYMVALSSASGIGGNTSMTPTPNLELMRQQLFAAQMRQQQSQPSLEALLEMQPAAAAGLPQSLGAAAGLFNSNLMSLGNAAAAANLQQALYSGKNPYSNTLEQLARQKREEDIMQSGR